MSDNGNGKPLDVVQIAGKILKITKERAGNIQSLTNFCKKIHMSAGKPVLAAYRETNRESEEGTVTLSFGILKEEPILISEVGKIELKTGIHVMHWLKKERMPLCKSNIEIFVLPFDVPPGLNRLTKRREGLFVGFDVFVGNGEIRTWLETRGENNDLLGRLERQLDLGIKNNAGAGIV